MIRRIRPTADFMSIKKVALEGGGPAFPITHPNEEGDKVIYDHGMTVHDYAAIKFMTALIANESIPTTNKITIARVANEYADAFIFMRNSK